jgi:PAP2 superfamily C-terminal
VADEPVAASAERQHSVAARNLGWRIGLTVVAIALWFWTQSLIGSRALPAAGIGDGMHTLTGGLNGYLQHATDATNALLIVSSAVIDAIGLFLLGSWIFGGSVRPFLALLLLLGLRQVMQALCALPAPPNLLWHYPGFPSLFVTYNVANDYFFSGHTGIAVLGAVELSKLRKPWLTALAVTVVVFEAVTVLILRAHYTMDVFTGALAALWAATVCDVLAPRIDRWMSGAS